MALGGIWAVRGRWGEMNRDGTGTQYTPEIHIASEFINLFPLWAQGISYRISVPNTHEHMHDEVLKYIISKGGKYCEDEWDTDRTGSKWQQFKVDALHFMRRGIIKHDARWGFGPKSNTMFWNIQKEVDRELKYIEHKGQQFILAYGNNQARLYEDFNFPDNGYH